METIECECDKCGMGFFVSTDCIDLEIQKTNNGGKYVRKTICPKCHKEIDIKRACSNKYYKI